MRVDAVVLGLLQHLNPRLGRLGEYTLDCPACRAPASARYSAGQSVILCPDGCKAPTPVVKVVSNARAMSSIEAERLLAIQANERDLGVDPDVLIRKALKACLLAAGPAALKLAGLTRAEADRLPVGMYPGSRSITDWLANAGCAAGDLSRVLARLPAPDSDDDALLARCLVGFWVQPDGSQRLWGLVARLGPQTFHYERDLVMDRPYLLTEAIQGDVLVAVPFPLDALSLRGGGMPACALGGEAVTPEQAGAMAGAGARRLVMVVAPSSHQSAVIQATNKACAAVGVSVAFTKLPSSTPLGSSMRPDRMLQAVRKGLRALPTP